MRSSRVILKLAITLLVTTAVAGQLHNRALAIHFTRPDAARGAEYMGQGICSAGVAQFVAAKSSSKNGPTTKRHKRLLITKFFQPAPSAFFIKRYRLLESFTDYSSPHILQKAVAFYSLRGPPSC